MCLKVVIEDQVEGTKFAQENPFLAYTSIAVSIPLNSSLDTT